MNIGQLLESTDMMGGNRTISACFGKEIGTIFLGNKEVIYKPAMKYPVVEISMYIGAVTQKDRNLHKVSIALKGMAVEHFNTISAVVQYVKNNMDVIDLLNEGKYIQLFNEKVYNYYKELSKKTNISEKDLKEAYNNIGYLLAEQKGREEAYEKTISYYSQYQEAKQVFKDEKKKLSYIRDNDNLQDTYIRDFIVEKEEEYKKLLKMHGGAEKNIFRQIKMGQYVPTTVKSKVKDFIPDEFIFDLILKNPEIVKGKIILPKNTAQRAFVAMDNRISLDTTCKVRCSCFTGDTRVQLANGTTLTLKDLENMTDFKVLAYNTETGNYEYVRALNCTKRQENAKIMKVTLADGTSIRVTPSHRFLNSNCEWKQAQDLKVGDLLKFNYKYWGYKNHEQHTSSSTFIYLDPTQEGDYQFGELRFTHKPFYVGITTGAYVKIENERCLEYLDKLADMNEQPLMFKQY